MRPLSPTLILAAAVSGCVAVGPDPALVARTALIGMPKAELLSCAGAPVRSVRDGDREYLTYAQGWSSVGPAPWNNAPWRRGWAFPDYVVTGEHCEANFTLRADRVERLVYGGDAAWGRTGQCAAIVAPCLPPPPPPAPEPAR